MAFFFLGTVPAAVSKVSRVATSSVILILTANSHLPVTHILFQQITEAIKHGKLRSFLLLAILYTAVIKLLYFRIEMKSFPQLKWFI